MPVDVNPRRLAGPWADGYALDLHTISSDFIGYNAYGHPEFSNQYSPMGELLNKLKYKRDKASLQPIVDTVVQFLANWRVPVDTIVPVPPSDASRPIQPVLQVAEAVSAKTGIPLCTSCVTKTKTTPQLKNVYERAKRDELLAGAFAVDAEQTRAKRLLLFDDLYRSGATVSAIAQLLADAGGASAVYLLTLTQTRRNV